jgi:methanogenic corrinoid protein MtbC1
MRDTHASKDVAWRSDGGGAIASFAVRVLDGLVERSRVTSARLRPDLVHALIQSMVTTDQAHAEAALAAFRRACISPVAMAERYIPAAARHLGSGWATDHLSFAEVSIATARLQALVRAIGIRWGGTATQPQDHRCVLMIVPAGEQHTLGAVVATAQLRRMGMSVCLRLGPDRAEVSELLRTRAFDIAMLSIGHDKRLDSVARLVETLRVFGPRGLPLAAGGAVVADGADVVARTGVDFMAQDLAQALALCGCGAAPVAAAPPALVLQV